MHREMHERKTGQCDLEQKLAAMMEQVDGNYRQVQHDLQRKILESEEKNAIYKNELQIKIAELEARMAVYENTFFRRIWRRLTRRKDNL